MKDEYLKIDGFVDSVDSPFDDVPIGLQRLEPITLSGTFDDSTSAISLHLKPIQRMTIAVGRRFLWWNVTERVLFALVMADDYVLNLNEEDGTTRVVVQPFVTTWAPWWERALYHIAWLWSRVPSDTYKIDGRELKP